MVGEGLVERGVLVLVDMIMTLGDALLLQGGVKAQAKEAVDGEAHDHADDDLDADDRSDHDEIDALGDEDGQHLI